MHCQSAILRPGALGWLQLKLARTRQALSARTGVARATLTGRNVTI
jgi:hypothetical protein